jgi:hypothetical protein
MDFNKIEKIIEMIEKEDLNAEELIVLNQKIDELWHKVTYGS